MVMWSLVVRQRTRVFGGKARLGVTASAATVGTSYFLWHQQDESTTTTLLATRLEAAASTTPSPKRFYRDEEECLQPHIHQPDLPYPEWNHNWDGRAHLSNRKRKTRHILLIRHGQYQQQPKTDDQRKLTAMGREQALLTGRRVAELLRVPPPATENNHTSKPFKPGQSIDTQPGIIRLKAIHVSDMERAKETASIIASQLDPEIFSINNQLTKPDPMLNEGFPAPIIPWRPDVGTPQTVAEEVASNLARMQTAFDKYMHRSDEFVEDEAVEHEFEIIVGHANVIRYFVLRALQLPPEAWLRFSIFNCGLSYLMIGPDGRVTCRLIGDTGHIPYQQTTFSGAHGYNWGTPTST